MESSLAPLPEREYLVRIGEVAYAVAYLEWMILGDLHRLAPRLPPELLLSRLEPKMTSEIALEVKAAAKAEGVDEETRRYLIEVYKALFKAAAFRSDVLHARPATHPEQGQRLNRAETRNRQTTGQRFWIDDAWFDVAIAEMNNALSAVTRVRPVLVDG